MSLVNLVLLTNAPANFTGADTMNVTIRFGGSQYEIGALTSFIPTTGAPATTTPVAAPAA